MPPKLGDFWQVNFEGKEYTAIVREIFISTELELTEEDITFWRAHGVMDVEDMPPETAIHRRGWIYNGDGSLKDPTWMLPVEMLDYFELGSSYYVDLDPSAFIKQVPPVEEPPEPDFASFFKALGGLKPKPKPSMPMGILLGVGAGIILFLLVK